MIPCSSLKSTRGNEGGYSGYGYAVCNLNEHAKVEMTLACFFCFYNWMVACCKSMDSARSVP